MKLRLKELLLIAISILLVVILEVLIFKATFGVPLSLEFPESSQLIAELPPTTDKYTDKSCCETPEPQLTTPTQDADLVSKDWVYYLNPEDLEYIQRVVMAEAGNQTLEGQMAVAECILNQSVVSETTPKEVVTAPKQYSAPYSGEITESVREAVLRVFRDGELPVSDQILYFYSLATGRVSKWHESKRYIITIGDHKFFGE